MNIANKKGLFAFLSAGRICLRMGRFHRYPSGIHFGPKGFTLIETIMSMVILSIAVMGVLKVFVAGMAPRNAPISIEITLGNQLVQEGLEKIMAAHRNTSRGFDWIVTGNFPAETLTGGYSRTTTISTWAGDTDLTHFKQILVSVSHSGRTVASATTLVANY
jgi:prepilin-type N-terminal cleavage/methylation domain-containing protein